MPRFRHRPPRFGIALQRQHRHANSLTGPTLTAHAAPAAGALQLNVMAALPAARRGPMRDGDERYDGLSNSLKFHVMELRRKLEAELNTRLAKAEEIAPLVVYLASDESRWTNGANLVIDSGTTGFGGISPEMASQGAIGGRLPVRGEAVEQGLEVPGDVGGVGPDRARRARPQHGHVRDQIAGEPQTLVDVAVPAQCAQRFAAYHRQSPTALGVLEVRTFLDHLVRKRGERRLSVPKPSC